MIIDKYEEFLDHNKKEYFGRVSCGVSLSKATDKIIYRGSRAFIEIKRRCTHGTRNNPRYKGLGVGFTRKQFLYWWIIQNRFFKLNSPSVGRIDHSKGYYFDNIMLEDRSENSKEVWLRRGLGSKPISVEIYKNDKLFAIASSLSDASRCTGVKMNAVFHRVHGRYSTPMNGWIFKKKTNQGSNLCL